MGFLSTLSIIFVIAKLAGVVDWSWWLCFLPAIIAWAIMIVCFVIYGYAEYKNGK